MIQVVILRVEMYVFNQESILYGVGMEEGLFRHLNENGEHASSPSPPIYVYMYMYTCVYICYVNDVL